MKTNIIIGKILRSVFCFAFIAGVVSCDVDPLQLKGGKLPGKDGLENTYGILRSNNSPDNEMSMLMTQGAGFTTDNFYYQITKPAPAALSLDARVDPTLVEAYNTAHETNMQLLPEGSYEFPDGKNLSVAEHGQRSEIMRIKFLAGQLAPGSYLLPVTVAPPLITDAKDDYDSQTIYYTINIRQRQMGKYELDKDGIFMVFYINTFDYQPLLVDEYYMQKVLKKTGEEVWYRTIGNIINLRTTMVDYDAATGRAMMTLTPDMQYVLEHAVKYIRPLQDKGRKVCLSIEGAGKGLGFCNLTNSQITDFTAQVKAVVETYQLDGINLWDRNSGYGKVGMPPMNTTSYPRLIKALRAALGNDKLLTLTDHESPTEYFYDTQKTGGIEVGEYIDYAWSGYNSGEEGVQILDPWNPENQYVSQYTHKPIAGLDPSKYGCINMPFYSQNTPMEIRSDVHILQWKIAECKQSQIMVFDDLKTILQDKYEGMWSGTFTYCEHFADDGRQTAGFRGVVINFYSFDMSDLSKLPDGTNGYGKWLKDWR